jgi:hypothetical protein
MAEAGNVKMTFDVVSKRISSEIAVAFCKNSKIDLDTNLKGNPETFNPAELLLASLTACMIKGIALDALPARFFKKISCHTLILIPV